MKSMPKIFCKTVFYELVSTYRMMKPVAHASGWLMQVAKNRITDPFRRRKTQGAEDGSRRILEDPLPSPDAGPDRLFARGVIEAALGGTKDFLDIWVIWADMEIKIGEEDELDVENDAPVLDGSAHGQKKGEWPPSLGGGVKLGPYVFGIQCVCVRLYLWKNAGEGIADSAGNRGRDLARLMENVIGNGTVEWLSPTNYSDVSKPDFVDLDPTSGGSSGDIYDLDGPGCTNLPFNDIHHAAEKYVNFKQYATLLLDQEYICSDKTYMELSGPSGCGQSGSQCLAAPP